MQHHNLPEPLRGLEIPSFTHYSIVVRLPDIARRTLAENAFSAEVVQRIEQLISEIPAGAIRPVQVPLAEDAAQWAEYIRPYLGMNWLQVPWFFAEEYFYERILEASGYFQPSEGHGVDPYALQKRLGLETTRGAIAALAERIESISPEQQRAPDTWLQLLLIDLWGNQNDLSLWPARVSESGTQETSTTDHSVLNEQIEHLLVDDRQAALDHLLKFARPARIDILVDNAGFELVCDLALVDILLSSQIASQVVFHVKQQPVFVSDAMVKDVEDTLKFLADSHHPASQQMANRLKAALAADRLQIQPRPFWTSPLALWDMPEDLRSHFAQADLLITKGDANYRRLLGDRHWPLEKPFAEVLSYCPCAVLSLRTLKSEIAVGLRGATLPQDDPYWMSNGRWGLIQFAPSATRLP